MSSNSRQLPIKALARAYSAKAAPAQAALAKSDIRVSTLDNGLRLASLPSPTPGLAHISLMVKAGARYETYENQGAAHALRIAAGLASRNFSAFGITRHMQQTGSNLQVAANREYLAYNASFLPEEMDAAIDYFIEAATAPAFKPWELSDSTYRLNLELAGRSQQDAAADLLHKAAFREGLGNSVYTPEFMVGKHKARLVEGFFNRNVTSHRTALIGVGVDQSQLVRYAQQIKLEAGQGEIGKAKYYGGELRLDQAGSTATVNLAGFTAGYAANMKECVAAHALNHVLGAVHGRVKYAGATGKLEKALKDVSDKVRSATGVSYCYSDATLTGVQIVVEASAAEKAVPAVAAALRGLSISDADLAAAKKSMAMECDLGAPGMATVVGEQVLFTGGSMDVAEYMDCIKAVSLGEVQAVAKKAFGGKLAMSSVGNLSTVPYLDTL